MALGELWRPGCAYDNHRAKVPHRSSGQVTLLVGAEREGLPPELVAAADHVAHIPIATDSLNVAMAATVALYELANRMAAP